MAAAPVKMRGVWVGQPPEANVSAPLRNANFHLGLVDAHNECRTLADTFSVAAVRYANMPCMGVRDVLSVEQEYNAEAKRNFEKVHQGAYRFQTYAEVARRVKNFGAGLRHLGQKEKGNVALYAETKPAWQIAAQACFANSFPAATVYANLGEEAIVHALNETEVTTVITDNTLMATLAKVLAKTPLVTNVIYSGPDAEAAVLAKFSVTVHRFADVEALGAEHPCEEWRPVARDTAVIMYTSGSTGLPKGVVMSHLSMVSVLGALRMTIPNLGPTDTYIAYLPLAHVLELAAETAMLSMGARIGYGSPFTLTDKSAKVKTGTQGDVTVLQPTLMAAVPLVMDRIRKTVEQNVEGLSDFKKWMFNTAYTNKLDSLKKNGFVGIWDLLVFDNIKKVLGGKLRLVLSGGAPLSPKTQEFMNVCFGIPVLQGYGLTECCGGSCITPMDELQTGTVGGPLPCNQIRLVDWEEGGYRNADINNPEIGMRRGEICIAGPNLTDGYFKNEEKTNEVFLTDKDGTRWFHTGDIGQVRRDGSLQIIDRKKDLVKLQLGEYVSLGKVEAALKDSRYVENVMVYGDSNHDHVIAFVVPTIANVLDWARHNNVLPPDAAAGPAPTTSATTSVMSSATAESSPAPAAEGAAPAGESTDGAAGVDAKGKGEAVEVEAEGEGEDAVSPAPVADSRMVLIAQINRHPQLVEEVLTSLQKAAKSANLQKFEVPTQVYICAEEWNPANDLTTAALKLKRPNLVKHYRAVIDEMYAHKGESA